MPARLKGCAKNRTNGVVNTCHVAVSPQMDRVNVQPGVLNFTVSTEGIKPSELGMDHDKYNDFKNTLSKVFA